MRGISIKAVLVGGVTDIGLSMLLGAVLQAIFGSGQTTPTGVLFVVQLIVGLGCSVLGGYVAASIAKENMALNGLAASSLCVLLGVLYLFEGLAPISIALQLLLIVITPVCYLVGASLRLRRS
jgi:hypothetical protein